MGEEEGAIAGDMKTRRRGSVRCVQLEGDGGGVAAGSEDAPAQRCIGWSLCG
jgi:hypothetical protein